MPCLLGTYLFDYDLVITPVNHIASLLFHRLAFAERNACPCSAMCPLASLQHCHKKVYKNTISLLQLRNAVVKSTRKTGDCVKHANTVLLCCTVLAFFIDYS